MLRKVPILSIFLSTLSLRRATYQDKFSIPSDNISIHALLAESDGTGFFVLDERHDISIHALLAESDTPTLESLTPTQTFLSTLSLRRATRPVSALYSVNRYFYPRSPCGERPHPITILVRVVEISIHALLAESDAKNTSIAGRITSFLSTLSLRRATAKNTSIAGRITSFLSTLSLRRATIQGISTSRKNTYFYPRSPCGERRDVVRASGGGLIISIHALLAESDPPKMLGRTVPTIFLSTLSLRRATHPIGVLITVIEISIHALLAESDREPTAFRTPHHIFLSTLSLRRATGLIFFCVLYHYFYPRSPCGERHQDKFSFPPAKKISIHALLAESDDVIRHTVNLHSISIHALLAESDERESQH